MSVDWLSVKDRWKTVFRNYHVPITDGEAYMLASKCRSLTNAGLSEYVALHRIIAELKVHHELSEDFIFDLYAAIDAVKLDEAHRQRYHDICDDSKEEADEQDDPPDDDFLDDRMWRYF